VFIVNFGFGLEATAANVRGGEHAVVENCVLISNPMGWSQQLIGSISGLCTIRNCMFITLNTPQYAFANRNRTRWEVNQTTERLGKFTRFIATQRDERSAGQEMTFLHNTYVNLRPSSEFLDGPFEVRDAAWDSLYTVIEGHNVTFAPNLTTPIGPAMSTIDMPPGVRVLNVAVKWTWERQTFTLPAPVGPGQTTPPIPYPADWYNNPTTGASYAGAVGNNALNLRTGANDVGLNYTQLPSPASRPNSITVNHDRDASGNAAAVPGTGTHFTVTNRHPTESWSGAITVILTRGTTAMEPDVYPVDQSAVKLYRPTSPQALTPGVRSTLFDFDRTRLRPNSGFAIAPTTGVNTAGALLPA
jgi:hypothetical protein